MILMANASESYSLLIGMVGLFETLFLAFLVYVKGSLLQKSYSLDR